MIVAASQSFVRYTLEMCKIQKRSSRSERWAGYALCFVRLCIKEIAVFASAWHERDKHVIEQRIHQALVVVNEHRLVLEHEIIDLILRRHTL